MAERIEIVIQATDKATAPLKTVTKSVEKMAEETKKTASATEKLKDGWASFAKTGLVVAGVAGATGAALKKVYDLAKEGAGLEYAARKFDRLAESAGTTSKILMRDLSVAVKGTKSNMELMASAGDFMALGLAKTADEVVRLTRVAGGLGMDMNQLVLTLANQTTMRFDQLGVSIDGFDEKVKKLTDSGMDASAAFKEAFLQQAEAQLQKVGDIAETDAGKIARMEASVKNLADAFKMKLAPAIATVADSLASNLNAKATFDVLQDEIIETTDNYKDYANAIYAAAIESKRHQAANDATVKMLRKAADAQVVYTGDVRDFNAMTAEQILTIAEQEGWLEDLILLYGGLSEGTYEAATQMDFVDRMARKASGGLDEVAAAVSSAKVSMEKLKLFMAGDLGKELNSFNNKQKDLKQDAADIRSELAKLGVSEYLTEDQKAQISLLQNKLYYANENLRDFAKGIDVDFKRAVNALDNDKLRELGFSDSEIEGWTDLREEAWSLEGAIRELGSQPYLTEAQLEQLETSKEKLKEIQNQIILNANEHEKATKRILFNMMEQQLALGGLSEKEQGVLWELAYNWGLIDKETKDAYDRTIEYAGAIDGAGESMDIAARKLALLTDKHIWITTTYVEEYVSALEHGTAQPPTHPGDQNDFVLPPVVPPISPSTSTAWGRDMDYSRGVNMIVPPGYPNDSYGPIYVESGEHVRITPANEVAKDMRTFNFNYTGNATRQQIEQSYEMARLRG